MSPAFQNGFSLITMIFYVAALAMIVVVLMNFTANVIRPDQPTQSSGQVLDDARYIATIIAAQIRLATAIYTPTSSLSTHPGQLSLATTANLPADENETYVDFYVDDERVFVKREGESALQISSERIKVTNLVFTEVNSSTAKPGVQMSFTAALDADDPDAVAASQVSLTSTAALRSY